MYKLRITLFGEMTVTPHRTDSLAGYAMGSLVSLKQLPIDSTGVALTGIAGGVAWAFGAGNVSLLWIVGMAMLLDLLVGALGAVIDPLKKFSIEKLYGGLIGKVFRSLMIPAGSLLDRLYVLSPFPLPDGYEAVYPATQVIMYALAGAELTSAFNKFREGGVSPKLISVIMRHMDRMKLGEEPPTRRDYDTAAIAAEAERDRPEPETSP